MGKRKQLDEFADYWTVNVLGAHEGMLLRGVRKTDSGLHPKLTDEAYASVAGVELEVAQGELLPFGPARERAREVWNRDNNEGWNRKVGSALGLSAAQAAQAIQMLEDRELEQTDLLLGIMGPRPLEGTAAHTTDGVELRFRVRSSGAWSFAPESEPLRRV